MDLNIIFNIVKLMFSNLIAFVEICTNIIISTAAIITASVAFSGINAWKKQFREKRKIQLAEDVLTQFYQVQDAIIAIRSTFGGSPRETKESETPEEKKARDILARCDYYQEPFNKLYSLRFPFKAVFGEDTVEPFNEIMKIKKKIICNAHMFEGLPAQKNRAYDTKEQQKLIEEEKEYRKIISSPDPRKDELAEEVKQAINEIEKVCKKVF